MLKKINEAAEFLARAGVQFPGGYKVKWGKSERTARQTFHAAVVTKEGGNDSSIAYYGNHDVLSR